MTQLPFMSLDTPTTVAQLLASAQARLDRLSPPAARAAMAHGAVLIDIRSDSQRLHDGIVPGACFVARNVAEWRLDPASPHRDPLLARADRRQILLCNEGYQSSLLAATLQQFGLRHATDVVGGFQAWRTVGLPVQRPKGQGGERRAVTCPCGRRLEAVDDAQLLRLTRHHVRDAHPEVNAADELLRARIAADAYDVTVSEA